LRGRRSGALTRPAADLSRGSGRGGRGGSSGSFLDHGQDLPARDGGAIGNLDLPQHAARRRRHFEHDLVGLEVDQVLVAVDGIARLLAPRDERGIGHRLG